MQIAIISDVHDNIPNLTKAWDYCRENKIEKIICCGDLASLETLDFLNDNFQGEIFFVFGNMDNDYLKNYPFENGQYKNTQIFKDCGEIEIEKKNIAFVHFPQEARELCESGKYDFVFHGHTHKPWVSSVSADAKALTDKETTADQAQKKCTLLNPGNIASQIYPPTFAVWDTSGDSFQLIRINELS